MTSHLRTLLSEEDSTDKTTTSPLVTTELGIIKKFKQSVHQYIVNTNVVYIAMQSGLGEGALHPRNV